MEKTLWGEMTWPEIQAAAKQQRVVILPVGVTEQHGRHLPTNADYLVPETLATRVAERIPDRCLVAPSINHGFTAHNMDWPGGISVSGRVFIDYVADVCRSIVHNGFDKVLVLNGHGGNIAFLEVAIRLAALETGAFIGLISHWQLEPFKRSAARVRESPAPSGFHACELETSLYLAIRPELVQMEQRDRNVGLNDSRYFWIDTGGGGDRTTTAGFIEPFSAYTESGTMGDATLATAAKGAELLEAALQGLRELVLEVHARPLREAIDHHERRAMPHRYPTQSPQGTLRP